MESISRFWLATSGILGAIGVGLGAFGAHGLKNYLSPEALAIYDTGARYLMYHIPGLLAVGILAEKSSEKAFQVAGWCFLTGILIFTGSLMAIVFTGIKKFGMITPIGGTLFIIGWLALSRGALKRELS